VKSLQGDPIYIDTLYCFHGWCASLNLSCGLEFTLRFTNFCTLRPTHGQVFHWPVDTFIHKKIDRKYVWTLLLKKMKMKNKKSLTVGVHSDINEGEEDRTC